MLVDEGVLVFDLLHEANNAIKPAAIRMVIFFIGGCFCLPTLSLFGIRAP